ncbi:MAG: mechanosensitive ion channel domain-containing protein [Pseudomonadota bacterium]
MIASAFASMRSAFGLPGAGAGRVVRTAPAITVLLLLGALVAGAAGLSGVAPAMAQPFVSTGQADDGGPGQDDAADDPSAGPMPRGVATGGVWRGGGLAAVPSHSVGATGAAAGSAATPASPQAPAADEDPLIDLLRDRATRQRLIRALERLEAEAEGPAPMPTAAARAAQAHASGDAPTVASAARTAEDAAATEAAESGPPRLSLGRRIGEITSDAAAEIAQRLSSFYAGVAATHRRMAGFAKVDKDRLIALAEEIGLTILTTFATFLILRRLARPLRRSMAERAAGGAAGQLVWVFAVSVAIDLMTVLLAWGSGNAIALYLRGEIGALSIYQAMFLNAFLAVELTKMIVRIGLSPSERRLRIVPLGDAVASYWAWWSSVLISILGYGRLLLMPLVNELVNLFTGRAFGVMVYVVVLVLAMMLVVVHRRAPAAYFAHQAKVHGGDVTLEVLAAVSRHAWIGVLLYLGFVFVSAVAETGQVLPVLAGTGKILGIIVLGALVTAILSKSASRGVRVPGGVHQTLPLLERRLNTFVPAFLRLVRFLVMIAVLGFAADVIGLMDVDAWLDSELGGDATSTLVSVLAIILIAFVVWLALTSWIDYRLTPRGFRLVTSREQTLLTLLKNAGTIAIMVVTTMFSLSEIGIDIAPLIASAGVLGLAIGFGAQKMVEDIITGIFIQFENAINVGDVITVGGTTGAVEKLTIRSVSLRDLEGVFHVIPFSSVSSVSNYMRGFAYHVADLGIAYREDVDQAKAVMVACFDDLRADPDWRTKIAGDFEWFGVQELGDSAVVLRARIKTTPGNQWAVGRRYTELLKKACDRAGIEIPFPHLTLWMGEGKDGAAPPVRVQRAAELPAAAPALSPPADARPTASPAHPAPKTDMPQEAS